MIIQIAELFGAVCVDPEDGGQLCGMISQALGAGETVRLDFQGITAVTGSFLSAAIACLYGDYTEQALEQRIIWLGLDEMDLRLVRLIRDNATRYWRSTETQRQRIIDATEHPVARR